MSTCCFKVPASWQIASEILTKMMAFHHLMVDCRIHLNFAMWTCTVARILFVFWCKKNNYQGIMWYMTINKLLFMVSLEDGLGCLGVLMKSGLAVPQLCGAPWILGLWLGGIAEVEILPLILWEFKGKGQGLMFK